jgi:hypothetical protein
MARSGTGIDHLARASTKRTDRLYTSAMEVKQTS